MGIGDTAAPEFDERDGEEPVAEVTDEQGRPAENSGDEAESKPAKVGDRAEEALREFREEFDRDEPQ